MQVRVLPAAPKELQEIRSRGETVIARQVQSEILTFRHPDAGGQLTRYACPRICRWGRASNEATDQRCVQLESPHNQTIRPFSDSVLDTCPWQSHVTQSKIFRELPFFHGRFSKDGCGRKRRHNRR